MELGKVKKIQDTQTQSASSSSSSRSSSSSAASSSSRRGRVRDSVFYDDDRNMSVKEIYSRFDNSSLFKGVSYSIDAGLLNSEIKSFQENNSWKISMDTDGNGEYKDVGLLEAIANSFDSELDLYIQDKLEQVIAKYGSCSTQYLSDKALAELKSYGIVVENVGTTNRVYSFSLVDEDGNVLTDANGKKGSIIFGDCIVPDGYAQSAEVQLASILDCMGYDCISKADFIGREDEYWEVLAQVQENINNGLYEGKGNTNSIYKNVSDIANALSYLWGGNGHFSGEYLGSGSGSGQEGVSGGQEVVDKQTEKANQTSEYTKKLNKAIAKYKAEHGEEPTGAELRMIESSVQRELGLSNSDVQALK